MQLRRLGLRFTKPVLRRLGEIGLVIPTKKRLDHLTDLLERVVDHIEHRAMGENFGGEFLPGNELFRRFIRKRQSETTPGSWRALLREIDDEGITVDMRNLSTKFDAKEGEAELQHVQRLLAAFSYMHHIYDFTEFEAWYFLARKIRQSLLVQ